MGGLEQLFNLVDGIIRVLVFLIYVVSIGLWKEMRRIFEKMKENDALILFMANPEMVSFLPQMQQIPNALNEYFRYRH